MANNPYESPDAAGQSPPQKRTAGGFLTVLAGIAIVGILIAMFMPAPRTAREAARRNNCAANLKQIALALHTDHDSYGSFPPVYTVDADGKPLHSWRTLLLPFLEEAELYQSIDFSKPWDDPANREARENAGHVFMCPSSSEGPPMTTYLAVVDPNGVFREVGTTEFAHITDGSSNTLFLIEIDLEQDIHWMSPVDTDLKTIEQQGLNSQHPGIALGAFADGSVHTLQSEMDFAWLRAMVTVGGDDNDLLKDYFVGW